MKTSYILVGVGIAALSLKIFAVAAPLEPTEQIPDYYHQTVTSAINCAPGPTIKTTMLNCMSNDEAIDRVNSISDQTFTELQPFVVQLVQKLQSEGNTLEKSKTGAAILIANFTPECTGLSKPASKDFSRALVEASTLYTQ